MNNNRRYKCQFILTGFSAYAKKRIIEIKVKDNRGIKGDTAEIIFDDRDHQLEFPPLGKKFQVSLGYKGHMTYMGIFEINKVILKEGPKITLTVIGSPIYLVNSTIKNPTTKKFPQKTIGTIFNEIAKKNGYKLECDPSICAIFLDHIVQRKESDLSFMTRLADENDAYLKITDGKIKVFPKNKKLGEIIFNRGQAKHQISISGFATVIPTTITMELAERTRYTGVEVKFHDKDKNKSTEILVGSNQNVYQDSRVYESYSVAKRIASARLSTLQRNVGILKQFSTPGDGNIKAGMTAMLIGFRTEISSEFHIKEAVHTMNASGYITTGSGDQG